MSSYSKYSRQEFYDEMKQMFHKYNLEVATKACIMALVGKVNDLIDRVESLEDRLDSHTNEGDYCP